MGTMIKPEWHPYPETKPPKDYGTYYITTLDSDGETKKVVEACWEVSTYQGETSERWMDVEHDIFPMFSRDYTGVVAWAERFEIEPYGGDGFYLDGN